MEEKHPKQNNWKEEAPGGQGEVVLPDECGDSLWDKVLQQDDKCIYPAGTCERTGLLNNIKVENNEQTENTSPIPGKPDLK